MDKMKIGLAQTSILGAYGYYFPLSVGLMQSYARAHARDPERYEFLLPVYSRIAVPEAVERLLEARVAAFSAYIWSAEYLLKVAERLKRRNPAAFIVFGGPHVPNAPAAAEKFLRENPFVDVACNGEGEKTFLGLLENFEKGAWRSVASISFIDEGGRFQQNPRAARIQDLDTIPSPYLDGYFDRLIEGYPGVPWTGLLETNRGCPFSCSFCDWGGSIASKVYPRAIDTVGRELEWFAKNKVESVFCTDANFGILPRDVEIARRCAEIKALHGYPKMLNVHNAKNAPERVYEVQRILSDSGLAWKLMASLQSVDPVTLKNIKRDNIKLSAYHELQTRAAAHGMETITEVIMGLPGETYDSYSRGISEMMERGQHSFIMFYPLIILPNAEIGDPEYRKKFGLVTRKVQRWQKSESEAPEPGDEYYTEEFVIATESMPKEDWARARAFSWMADLLHFDKVLQLPIIALHEAYGVPYRDLIELFSEAGSRRRPWDEIASPGPGEFPLLTEIRSLFLRQAEANQAGGIVNCESEHWPKYYCPPNEYTLLKLCREDKVDGYYAEAEAALNGLLRARSIPTPNAVLRDAVLLNKSLLRLPFQNEDLELELSYNLWEFVQSVIQGRKVPLENKPRRYRIDRTSARWNSWDAWFNGMRRNRYDKESFFNWGKRERISVLP